MRQTFQMDRYDLVVVGAGAAGEAAAHKGRELGASVAIVDRALFGGSCPFWACMPSKALLHAAAVHHAGGDYPWAKASDFRDCMINRTDRETPDDSGHVKSLEGAGATVIRGSAALDGPGRVRVGDQVIEAGAVILAIGTTSRVPDLPGLAEAHPWTNVQGTSTRTLPRSLVILGAGPTGVELAQVYARYGVPVTLVHPRDRVHDREHPLSSRLLGKVLAAEGVTLRLGCRATRVRAGEGADGAHVIELDAGEPVEGHEILLAIGRDVPLDGLGLESVGVTPEDGRLEPDERLRITENVYLAGDVAGPEMHTHLGHYTGEAAARIALGQDYRPFLAAIPRATYTDPETASVGLLWVRPRSAGSMRSRRRSTSPPVEGLHRGGRGPRDGRRRPRRSSGCRRLHGRSIGVGGDPRMRPRHSCGRPARHPCRHDPRLPDHRARPRHGLHRGQPGDRGMTDFIGETTDLLRRTPELLRVLLGGIGEGWTDTADVPGQRWRRKDVVGHLITGELTDWVERTQRILEHGTSLPFERFDRLAHEDRDADATLGELVEHFAKLRGENLARLAALVSDDDLDRRGLHPSLGEVTLRELLATWAVHDLDHVSQIFAGMAGSHDAEVGPWKAYPGHPPAPR